MDGDGNVTFAVYGYMNRGAHEGEVGAAIYYYQAEQNNIDEKAFIPSNKSAAVASEELGKAGLLQCGPGDALCAGRGNAL